MKKKRILTFVFVTIFFIVGTGSIVLYKLGDRIFDEVINSQIEELEKEIVQLQNEEESPENKITSKPPSETTDTDADKGTDTGTQPDVVIDTQQPTTQSVLEPEKITSESQEAPAKQPVAETKNEINITKDKLEDIKQSVTPQDKITAAALVLSRLSKSDIDYLTKLAANGITSEEKEKMKAIVYNRFSKAEIEKIKEMYYKYMR